MDLLLIFRKTIWAGLAYRYQDALAFMGGIDIARKIRVGYSYDLPLSEFSEITNGSHEVVLSLMLEGSSGKRKYKN